MAKMDDLLALARQHIEEREPNAPACLSDHILQTQLLDDDDTPSLESILGIFFNPADDKLGIRRHTEILVLEAWLRGPGRPRVITTGDDSPARTARILNSLRQAVIDSILPTQPWAERLHTFQVEERAAAAGTEDNLARLGSRNVAGLKVLAHLERIHPWPSGREDEEGEAKLTVALTACLASFTDSREEWSGGEASDQAGSLLDHLLRQCDATPERFRSLIAALLEQTVKPLFAQTKNLAITAQGRKAIGAANPTRGYVGSMEPESELKPWKFHRVYVVAVFRWILENLEATSIEAYWPLLIPPLLALVDDASTPFKIRGCELLTLFLSKAPSPLLKRTGLGEVFRDALMPYLLYLPSLTPENESTAILDATYGALLALNRRLFPGDGYRLPRTNGFDVVMRDGIFKGYAHAGENVRIAELLVKKMTDLINELGIDSAKHLKHILPLLSQVLSAPFATAYPPLLEAAIYAMDTIIANVWPRVAYHRGEILEGLVICWCRIQGEETQSEELGRIQTDLHRTVRLVTAILKMDMDVTEEYQTLLDSDPRLHGLLN